MAHVQFAAHDILGVSSVRIHSNGESHWLVINFAPKDSEGSAFKWPLVEVTMFAASAKDLRSIAAQLADWLEAELERYDEAQVTF